MRNSIIIYITSINLSNNKLGVNSKGEYVTTGLEHLSGFIKLSSYINKINLNNNEFFYPCESESHSLSARDTLAMKSLEISIQSIGSAIDKLVGSIEISNLSELNLDNTNIDDLTKYMEKIDASLQSERKLQPPI